MTIQELFFQNAELSLASYATLDLGPTETAKNIGELIRSGMSLTQATQFAKLYPTVVTTSGDPTTGFQVTVFKDTAGNLTVAFRGTEIPEDLPTGADMIGLGAAYDQIVAMANWWERASAQPGQMVQQFRLARYAPEAVPADAVVLRPNGIQVLVLEAAAPAEAFSVQEGNLSEALLADSDHRVDVTGHSLGGHLSMAFSSLFAARTGQVTVFNTPGFIDNATNQAFFAKLGGSIPTNAAGNIVNVAADEALVDSTPFNWIAGRNSRPGEQINIAIEKQFSSDEPAPFSALNHSIVALTDSLAVYKLLADLDPTLTRENYKIILNQAAMFTAASYERIVDTLESLFRFDDTPLPSGNGRREDLYQAITDLRDPTKTPQYFSKLGLLEIRPTPDTATPLLAGAASAGVQGLAYRYAIGTLAPILVLGDEAQSLYAAHNANGELDLYNAGNRTGALTTQWLEDRAAFLERKLYITGLNRNQFYEDPVTSDPNVFPNAPDERGRAYQFEAKHFEDRASGFIASDGSPNRNSQLHYIFGGAQADNIVGAGREDRLYGSAGSDILEGKFAADYLEGGSGLDTYRFSTTDGADTVLDVDGRGVLIRNGGSVTLGVRLDETHWAFGSTTYTKTANGTDLEITFADNATDKITINNFDFAAAQLGGSLGIRLVDAPSAPTGEVRTFFGDKQDWDSDPNANGIQPQGDGFGNSIRADGQGRPDIAEPGRADVFYGAESSEVERFTTAGGDDEVRADGLLSATSSIGGRDLIETGAGRDLVVAGVGDDWVEGGVDADIVSGNAGNDTLYAQTTNGQTLTIAQAITAGETEGRFSNTGELLTGDAGQDMVFGAATDDLLLGGAGMDLIVGGGGDDTLYGDVAVTTADRGWTVQRAVITQGGTTRYEVTGQNLTFFTPGASSGDADSIYAGAGADWVFAGAGDDYIEAGNDNDVAFGEAGSDVLIGGAGDDVLSGDNAILVFGADEGADYLDGGAGNDTLLGDGNDDILYGGAGEDYLGGGAGADILFGGPGTDVLVGGAGKDTYVFNRGDGTETILDVAAGADNPEASVLVLGEGISRTDIKFRVGSLMVDLGQGDAIHFEGFDALDPNSTPLLDSIQFADGTAMSYQDVLDQGFEFEGTEDDDVIDGTAVTDRIDARGGNDVVSGRTGDDTIIGGAGDDVLLGEAGNDIIEGGEGIDSLDGDYGDDALAGNEGADELFGGGGNDVLGGGADDDRLTGDGGNDVVTGGTGNDVLIGSDGTDVYTFAICDGQDRIDEQGVLAVNLLDTASIDVVRFAEGIAPASVMLAARGNGDLIIRYGSGDQVTVKGQYRIPGNAIERIEFADGTVLDSSALNAVPILPIEGTNGEDVLYGTDGNDTLRGFAGDDVLDGGLSPDEEKSPALLTDNDRLEGGAGADTYAMYLGMGTDTIVDASASPAEIGTLKLAAGLTLDSVRTQRRGDDLFVSLRSGQEGALIAGYYGTAAPAQIWQVVTEDGTATPIEDVINRPDPNADDIAAAAREDYKQNLLSSWSVLSQSAQLPTHALVFNSYSQTVRKFIFDPNLPPQVIVDPPETSQFIEGFGVRQGGAFASVSPFQTLVTPVFVSQETDDAAIQTLSTASSSEQELRYDVTLGGVAKNVSGSLTTTGFSSLGQIPIVLGTTTTSTNESWRNITLTLDPGAAPANSFRLFQRTEERVIEEITAGDSDNQIEGAIFSNGSHVALVDAGSGNDNVNAGAFDFVYGNDGSDLIRGGRIVFGGNDSDTLIDGATLYGGAGSDALIGGTFMAGGEDGDFLSGKAGATVFHFDPAETGEDFVEDLGGVDPADFADWYYGSIGIEQPQEHVEFAGMYVVGDDTTSSFERIAGVYEGWFGPRPEGLLGRRDPYSGNSDADAVAYFTLEDMQSEFARFGIPYLASDIRYIEPLPDVPQVTANDYAALESLYAAGLIEMDTVEFGEGIGIDDVTPYMNDSGNLALTWGAGKSLHVTLATATDLIGTGVERFQFADGTTVTLAQMLERSSPVPLPTIIGTQDGDNLVGTADSERILGLGGADSISGLGGNDELDGGAANDFLAGGEGDDVYVFGRGDGIDFVFDEGGSDAVRFIPGIAPEDVGVTSDPYGTLYLAAYGNRRQDCAPGLVQRSGAPGGKRRIRGRYDLGYDGAPKSRDDSCADRIRRRAYAIGG